MLRHTSQENVAQAMREIALGLLVVACASGIIHMDWYWWLIAAVLVL